MNKFDKKSIEMYLARFRRQINKWGISMPDVEPLVSDFGLNEFEKTGLIEYWIANETAAGYCGKYLFVFKGQSCPMHRHKDKLETFHIVKGSIQIDYDGSVSTMNPGDTLLVERWKYHSFSGINGAALVLEVSTPCILSDNYFKDPAIKPYEEQ